MPVSILPSELVNQIAAGEVVERPASVVKELIENSIDAGAGTIEVILANGGRKLVEVRDDGKGMNEADARLAMERHATSKISSFDDLLRVSTLGFRGEALPSIASVSRFRLTTFDGISPHATEVTADPVTGLALRPAARDRGTTVAVAELFENVPARRKFLKSADAEFRSIVQIISSYALPLPRLAFRIEHNGRTVLDLPPAGDRLERAVQVIGESEEVLSPIEVKGERCALSGFVTRGVRFGSRRHQYFFVNGRLVRDRVLTHAVSRATERFDFDGHPGVVLFIDIDPELVDVNVHPAKTEVRFRESGLVHVLVEEGVKNALGGAGEGDSLIRAGGEIHDRRYGPHSPSTIANGVYPALFPPQPQGQPAPVAHEATPLFRERPVVQPPVERYDPAPSDRPPDLGALEGRVIGQYRMSYILLDTPGGLRLVDQHVAHERVLYDRYRTAMELRTPSSQQLLVPYLYQSNAAEAAILETHLEELRAAGFEIAPFSGHSFAVSSVPPGMEKEPLDRFFRKLIDASLDEKASPMERLRERIIASLACQAAIKVHRPLGGEEMSKLVAELLASSNPYACPHGRPIIVDIRHVDIEKHFHRR